ncbi:hypothetical protein D9615_006825 [Tricholomella constricta]|uniref:Uncharacterized protein n=1 Tax=Tricholomella constricta TaxID=117010 RepID=A0A8H5M1I6_9AGAR|nr:hypothetical protein D9615_006825 [Tricholomella constricta]
MSVAPRSHRPKHPPRTTSSPTTSLCSSSPPPASLTLASISTDTPLAAPSCSVSHLKSPPLHRPKAKFTAEELNTTRIRGLILHNSFTSNPGNVHLTELPGAIQIVAGGREALTMLARPAQKMLVLVSEHDEVVPCEMGAQVVRAVRGGTSADASSSAAAARAELKEGSEIQFVVIRGALHEKACNRHGWAEAVRAMGKI